MDIGKMIFDAINYLMNALGIIKGINGISESALTNVVSLWDTGITGALAELSLSPQAFSSDALNFVTRIADTVAMPIAGVLLTYCFCYEFISIITEKNSMVEQDVGVLYKVLIKFSLAIILVTHCQTIVLGILDLAEWVITTANVTSITSGSTIPPETIKIIASSPQDLGSALLMLLVCLLSFIGCLLAIGMVYLVIWSRIFTIYLYIAIAPIPFSTILSTNWLASIWQNYLKNVFALVLQCFFMICCLRLVAPFSNSIASKITTGMNSYMAITMLCVLMAVCVKSIMSCLTFAKNIVQAN